MPRAETPGASRAPRVKAPRRAGARTTRTAPPEPRRPSRARRNRVVLAIATVASIAIVAAWFPVSSLLHQRAQLGAASAALSRLDHENLAMHREAKQLQTPSALSRIAQQQYGLVSPGEQAYQVLPPSGSAGAGGPLATRPTTPTGGTGRSSRSSGPSARGGQAAAGTSGSFFTRVLQTLEFWR